jgi:pantoate kinase
LNNRKDAPRTAQAFVPGHITGFFRIHDDASTPLLCGSRGAGFSVEIGTLTTVQVFENNSSEITTIYNNDETDAQVTKMVVRRMVEDYDERFRVNVTHESSLLSGAGFGASGAGALGTALALGHLLDSTMPYEKAAGYAHEAEVVNHTGLGDVLAQTKGGFEIRVAHGGPGIGRISQIRHKDPLPVVLAGASGLRTHDVLTNVERRMRINSTADRLIEKMIENQDMATFISCSRKFSSSIGLATKRVTQAIQDLDSIGLSQSSMVMLGDSVFCFCEGSEIQQATDILCRFWDKSQVMTTAVSEKGGRLVSW